VRSTVKSFQVEDPVAQPHKYIHTPFTSIMPTKSPAQILLEKADKKANSSGGWFASATSKHEEAGDLYQQAANAFKIDKLFREAGDAHAREAECREKCQEINEAANAWWNAAKAYKRGNPDCM
jgi:alpha-soluble NSF attachment protein